MTSERYSPIKDPISEHYRRDVEESLVSALLTSSRQVPIIAEAMDRFRAKGIDPIKQVRSLGGFRFLLNILVTPEEVPDVAEQVRESFNRTCSNGQGFQHLYEADESVAAYHLNMKTMADLFFDDMIAVSKQEEPVLETYL